MIDRLRQMAIFAKTIDHGSFRGAARALRLSPSVVSHHISQLEEHLGVALLYRSTRKLSLTREGERLLAATHKMLDAVEGELLDLSVRASEPSGELRLTAPSVLSQSGFTDKVAAFSKRYPRITLSLDFSDTRRELVEDGFDIAIRMKPNRKRSQTTRSLFKAQRRLVAAPEYLAARARPGTPKDLMGWDWLGLTPTLNIPLNFKEKGGRAVTIKPAPTVFSNDAQAVYRLARAGAGLAVVPEFLCQEDVAVGRISYVLPEWQLAPIDVFASWHANAPKHGLIHLALESLSGPTSKEERTIIG